MKIAVVHSFYRSKASGENLAVLGQVRALRERGHLVELFSQYSEQLSSQAGYSLKTSAALISGIGRNPVKQIGLFNPDIVHVHNLFPNWGDQWIKSFERPVVATLHNFRPLCSAGTLNREGKFCDLCPTQGSRNAVTHGCYQNSRIRSIPLAISTARPTTNRIIRHSRRISFLSEKSRDLYLGYVGSELGEKSEVISNFVEDRNPIQGLVTVEQQAKTRPWLFAGRLSPEKGLIELISSWPQSEELLIAGDGPLLQEAQDRASTKNISFLGAMPNTNLRQQMRRVAGLVFPSVCLENSPLVLIEALAEGLPIVAKTGSAAEEIVGKSGAGELFGDFSTMPVALAKVKKKREHYSKVARQVFETHHSTDHWLDRIESFYSAALSS